MKYRDRLTLESLLLPSEAPRAKTWTNGRVLTSRRGVAKPGSLIPRGLDHAITEAGRRGVSVDALVDGTLSEKDLSKRLEGHDFDPVISFATANGTRPGQVDAVSIFGRLRDGLLMVCCMRDRVLCRASLKGIRVIRPEHLDGDGRATSWEGRSHELGDGRVFVSQDVTIAMTLKLALLDVETVTPAVFHWHTRNEDGSPFYPMNPLHYLTTFEEREHRHHEKLSVARRASLPAEWADILDVRGERTAAATLATRGDRHDLP